MPTEVQKRSLVCQSGESVSQLAVAAADPAETDVITPVLSAPGPPHHFTSCELPTQLLVTMSTRFLRQ